VLTPDECQLLGYLDKGKRKRKEKAGSLQWAYMAIARLGGFMDSKRTGYSSSFQQKTPQDPFRGPKGLC